jgi:hypothetical protein
LIEVDTLKKDFIAIESKIFKAKTELSHGKLVTCFITNPEINPELDALKIK